MSLRWCLPLSEGRGAGLGNELVPWARAFLMAREIGARVLPPAFGLNPRGYGRHFGRSRADWLRQRLLCAALPRVHFAEADYRAAGGGDAGAAFARFAAQRGLDRRLPLVVTTTGLWGGLLHVERATEFVRTTLARSRYAAANLAELAARLDPARLTVAMHVRGGDFASALADGAAYRGRFNVALPVDWFIAIGQALKAHFGAAVQFQVFSDAAPAVLAPLLDVLRPVPTHSAAPADVSDLLALASADLLVCSVSSYSLWAAQLSGAPYLWFAPQMQRHDGGFASIWGHEAAQQPGPTADALRAEAENAAAPGRAHAHAPGQPLPAALIAQLERRHAERRRSADIVRYGVVPIIPGS